MTEKRTEPAQDVIAGRNAVKEALRSARPIESILVARGARNGSLGDIVSKAKVQGVAVKEVDPKRLEFLCPGANHQGIAPPPMSTLLWRICWRWRTSGASRRFSLWRMN